MKQAAYDLCYLAACAVNEITPAREKIEKMNLENVYKMSRAHSLSALAAMALSSAQTEISPEWKAEKDKSVRNNILFDNERAQILGFMEKQGVRYLPLKGIILKSLYPKIGMREMADNDIFFDEAYRNDVRLFMESRGYVTEHFGRSHHDVYTTAPIFNFELHTELFSEETSKLFYSYYKNIGDRWIPDEGKSYGYHMSEDDHYVYMTAHEYKHFVAGGTGLRSLLDRYVYLLKKADTLHFDYIDAQCRMLGIDAFEKDARSLCRKVFGSGISLELNESETEMLEYYMFSTTYGTMTQLIQHQLQKKYGQTSRAAKTKYLFSRIFPTLDFYKKNYPLAYRCKILIPFAWLYRLVRAIFVRRKQIAREWDIVNKIDTK